MDATARLLLDVGNIVTKHGYSMVSFYYAGSDQQIRPEGWYALAVHKNVLTTPGIHTPNEALTPALALSGLLVEIINKHGY